MNKKNKTLSTFPINNQEELIRYLREHLTVDMENENQYYGDVNVIARVSLDGELYSEDSSYISAPPQWQSSNC